MKPEIWGYHAWIFLHSITLEYPDNPTIEDKKNMINFINSLQYVLPCLKCRINFQSHLKKYPLNENILSSKKNLVKWLIDIHNSVNKLNDKKELSYEEALRNILNHYEKNNIKNMIIIYVILIIIIMAFLIFLFKKFT